MSTTLTLDQQIPLSVHGVDAAGGTVAELGSVPAWTADPAAGTLTPSADGLTCTFVPGVEGDHTITASALAKAGDVDPLTTSITLTVTAAGAVVAVALAIVPGEPVPKGAVRPR